MTPKNGFLTSEFWMALAAMAAKIAAFLVTAQVIRTSDPNQLTGTITAVVVGIGTIWGLTHGSNSYVNARTDLKVQALAPAPPRQPGVR